MPRSLALFVALVGCSAKVPHPPYVAQPTSALVEVAFPPPPARPEAMPKQPADGAVWIDGEWTWRGRRWAWSPGRWVIAPQGSVYSPWTSVRGADGTFYFAPGVWRDASGAPIDPPKSLALGSAASGVIFDANGEVQRTGPNIDPDRAPHRPAADAGP